ncbi:MAG: glycosyltransferase [Planctomycetota bacterium]
MQTATRSTTRFQPGHLRRRSAQRRARPLRIGLIAHPLRTGGGKAVGQSLIAAMGRLGPQNEYLVTCPPRMGYEEIICHLPHAESLVIPPRGPLGAWIQWQGRLCRRLIEAKLDVAFSLANFPVPGLAVPQAVLLHNPHLVYPPDHAPHPNLLTRWISRTRRAGFARMIRRADMVFCQTRTMARRLGRIVSPSPRTALCPNAVSAQAAAGSEQVPQVFDQLRGRFVLFCPSHPFHHKNIDRLIDAIARHRELLEDVTVLLTFDQANPAAAKLLSRAAAAGLDRQVRNVGILPQAQLQAHYRSADAMILPTSIESFSGTYVEAMQFGCPILTSDMDFAHDVCGDAAVYFDPHDSLSICWAIRHLQQDAHLRDQLRQAAAVRSRQLARSWDQIAADVLGHLRALATGETPSKHTGSDAIPTDTH